MSFGYKTRQKKKSSDNRNITQATTSMFQNMLGQSVFNSNKLSWMQKYADNKDKDVESIKPLTPEVLPDMGFRFIEKYQEERKNDLKLDVREDVSFYMGQLETYDGFGYLHTYPACAMNKDTSPRIWTFKIFESTDQGLILVDEIKTDTMKGYLTCASLYALRSHTEGTLLTGEILTDMGWAQETDFKNVFRKLLPGENILNNSGRLSMGSIDTMYIRWDEEMKVWVMKMEFLTDKKSIGSTYREVSLKTKEDIDIIISTVYG